MVSKTCSFSGTAASLGFSPTGGLFLLPDRVCSSPSLPPYRLHHSHYLPHLVSSSILILCPWRFGVLLCGLPSLYTQNGEIAVLV